MKKVSIFCHQYLNFAHADNPNLFLNNINSIKLIFNNLQIFSRFSGLRPNLSEIAIFQAFVTPIPNYIVTDLEKIQKCFSWENSASNIKDDALCNDSKEGGLKM